VTLPAVWLYGQHIPPPFSSAPMMGAMNSEDQPALVEQLVKFNGPAAATARPVGQRTHLVAVGRRVIQTPLSIFSKEDHY
jgi:hypothetical protein